jgi:hypothetical protein
MHDPYISMERVVFGQEFDKFWAAQSNLDLDVAIV